MKKRMGIFAATLLAFALSFALVGCGGNAESDAGAEDSQDYSEAYVGNWKLCGMEEESEVVSEEDIALMEEEMGFYVLLELNDDKTASLNYYGVVTTGTWEAASDTECTIVIEGEPATAQLAEGKLTLSEEGSLLEFAKITADEAADLIALTSSSVWLESDSGFAPVTVASDEICTIEATDKVSDDEGDNGYILSATNNTDKAIYVQPGLENFSVNGADVEFFGGDTVNPGETLEIYIFAESEDVASVEELVNVTGTIEVLEAQTLDILATYPISLN